MRRVLVTGASGFIGRRALAPLIARGYEVHAVSWSGERPRVNGVAWYRADLLDAGETARLMAAVAPSHLLHFAWYAVPGKYQDSEENLRWCRVGIELLTEFAKAGGRRAVFAGSCFEYDLRHGYCVEGLTPCAPATRYGICKLSLGQIVTQCPPEGVSTAWGRIFYLYGPDEAAGRLVPAVTIALLKGERARCSHGRQVRDFMHVEDVAGAFVALLDSGMRGVVNIASGEPVTVRGVAERIAEAADGRGRIDFGAIEARADDPAMVVGDSRRLREEVGWAPRIALDEGIAATVRWWRAKLGIS